MAYFLLATSSLAVGATGTGAALVFSSGLRYEVKPKYLPLKSDLGFDISVDYNNPAYTTFGKKYRWYMVGQSRFNRRWWTRSLHELNKDKNVGNAFKGIRGGWWYWGDKSLNRVCRAAYLTHSTDIDGRTDDTIQEGETTDIKKFKEADVWKYCSFLHQKPNTIRDEDSYESDTIGADSDAKVKLISTKDPENDLFWEVKHNEFVEEVGTSLMFEKEKNSFFADIFNHQEKNNKVTIKEKCEEAYNTKITPSKDTPASPTKEETIKYCSLSSEEDK